MKLGFHGETVKVLADPVFNERFLFRVRIETSEVSRANPEQFAPFIRSDRLVYEEAMKAAGSKSAEGSEAVPPFRQPSLHRLLLGSLRRRAGEG